METEFPGSLVVMIWCFHCRALGSILGQGTEIPQATQHGQKKRKIAWEKYHDIMSVKKLYIV